MFDDSITMDCTCRECFVAAFLLQFGERPDDINKMQLVDSTSLYASYLSWMTQIGREPCSHNRFGALTGKFGYRRTRCSTTGRKCYYFLELVTPRNGVKLQLEKHSDAKERETR